MIWVMQRYYPHEIIVRRDQRQREDTSKARLGCQMAIRRKLVIGHDVLLNLPQQLVGTGLSIVMGLGPVTSLGTDIHAPQPPAFLLPSLVTAITTAVAAVLCTHLRLGCHDDTIVVFGMLEIALSSNQVAGRERVAGKRQIFLCDLRRRAPEPHVGAIRFVIPR
jgi:hypothetical protein